MSNGGRGVGAAALLVTGLTAASALLGFGRDIVIAAVFGAGADLDAYFVAQGLMNVVLGLVASAMAKATVPVVAREATDGSKAAASRTVSVALSVTLVVLGVASVLMWIAAGPVVAVLAPGFDVRQAELASSLTRIVLAAAVLIAGTNLLAAAAQAHRRFFWAGVQGVPFNLVMIASAALLGPGYGVAALAVGFVAGSAARLLCQLVPLRAIGLHLRVSFDLADPGFRAIARLVPALLLGSAVGNVNTLVDRAVGSVVGQGAISALSYAWRLVGLADTLLLASLVTALYPALGAAAGRDHDELRRLVGRGLAAVAVIVAPVSAGLLAGAGPVVSLVYQRGGFGAADAALTASAVFWYAPALLALGWREVVVRASLAVGDSRRPVTVALLAMAINVIGDLTMGLAWGVPGLAASTTLSLVFAAAANTWLLRRHHGLVDIGPMVGVVVRVLAAAAFAGGSAAVTARVLEAHIGAESTLALLVLTAAIGVIVLGLFAAILFALRAPETRVLSDAVRLVLRRGARL